MTNGAKADFSLSLCCWCNSCAISGKVLMNHTLTGGVMAQQKDSIALPEVAVTGEQMLQQLLRLRRSNRKFEDAPVPGEFAIQAAIGSSNNPRQCFFHR
jgi:hypothetical protein